MKTVSLSGPTTRSRRRRSLIALVATVASAAVIAFSAPSLAGASQSVAEGGGGSSAKPTIVLVHGAWAGGSSFDPVTAVLQAQGYTVVNAPNPLVGLDADVASVVTYVKKVVPGPVVLVGHSYGGMVITNAATQLPNVKALVYVDAYAPDAGETAQALTGALPGSLLGAPPETVFDLWQHAGGAANDYDSYIKPDRFREIFAASVPSPVAKLLAADQEPTRLYALQGVSGTPAWKTIPSWFFIGTDDQVIPPAELRVMARRAGSTVVEARAPHLAMYAQPLKVAQLIVSAAKGR